MAAAARAAAARAAGFAAGARCLTVLCGSWGALWVWRWRAVVGGGLRLWRRLLCGGNCGAKMAGAMATGSEGGGDEGDGTIMRGLRRGRGELDVRRWLLVRLGEAAAWCCSEAEAAGKC